MTQPRPTTIRDAGKLAMDSMKPPAAAPGGAGGPMDEGAGDVPTCPECNQPVNNCPQCGGSMAGADNGGAPGGMPGMPGGIGGGMAPPTPAA
jgi:hypothetical protein